MQKTLKATIICCMNSWWTEFDQTKFDSSNYVGSDYTGNIILNVKTENKPSYHRGTAQKDHVSQKRSIIANRKMTVHFLSSHRWTLCVTLKSPKGWLKTRIFTHFCIAFHIFIADNRRHYKFGMLIDHSKSQPSDDKLVVRSCEPFKFWWAPIIYLEWPKLEWSNFVHR